MVRAAGDIVCGRLSEAAAHLAAAEAYAQTAGPGRQHRLRVVIASLKLWLARRHGDLASVVEQVHFLASPAGGQPQQDITLDSDLRAVALLNLGTAEAWSLGVPDAQRHLREGAALARQIDRPYLEVSCLAQLGFASKVEPFATAQQRCLEAIALAERHGWGTEPVIAPALQTLAGTMVWLGQFEEAERWLLRSAQACQADTGPDIRLLLHHTWGLLHACRGRHREALDEFSIASRLQSLLAQSHALDTQITGWTLATLARAGMPAQASSALAALDDERARSGEIVNARAVIRLAEGDPAGALDAARDVLNGKAPVIGYVTVVEAYLVAGLAYQALGNQHAARQSAEHALALAESDRLVLPFAITGAADLLKALPRRESAHAALLTDILDALAGPPPARADLPLLAQAADLSPGELRVLRYLPTNLSRAEIAAELSVSVNTISAHIRSIYAKLQVGDRSSAVRCARSLRLLAASRA
jgi:LuxR family transcriptional regulator, maltose regulon positive regulatory protein